MGVVRVWGCQVAGLRLHMPRLEGGAPSLTETAAKGSSSGVDKQLIRVIDSGRKMAGAAEPFLHPGHMQLKASRKYGCAGWGKNLTGNKNKQTKNSL